jgi:hypothetical protein
VQVLTPSGYKHPSTLANGDEVCAFDLTTGAVIINHVENIDFVDYAEWCRWWQVEAEVPAYNWVRVNGDKVLFGEQSIWRNGSSVCHAKHLVVGDEIYDDADQPIQIISVEAIEDRSGVWYRFDISGDHSYIVDGIAVHNASRFWVGGTGTWDSSTTTHWGSASGTADNASVPGSADTVTLNGSSGGGTVTLNFGGTITIQSLGMGAFTGTFENSVNNNNITVSAGSSALVLAGSATRTFKLGSATYTLTSTGATFDFSATTNATFTPGTSTISFTGGSGAKSFIGGDKTYATVSLGATSGNGTYSINNSNTIANFLIAAPCWIEFQVSNTTTITNAVTWTGTSSSQIAIVTNSNNGTSSIAFAASSTMQYCAFRGITATGSPIATNSFNLINNTGISITGPSAGGGGGSVIGS